MSITRIADDFIADLKGHGYVIDKDQNWHNRPLTVITVYVKISDKNWLSVFFQVKETQILVSFGQPKSHSMHVIQSQAQNRRGIFSSKTETVFEKAFDTRENLIDAFLKAHSMMGELPRLYAKEGRLCE